MDILVLLTWLFIIARRHIIHRRTSSGASPSWYFFIFRCRRLVSDRANVNRLKFKISSELWLIFDDVNRSVELSISLVTTIHVIYNSTLLTCLLNCRAIQRILPHHFYGCYKIIKKNIETIVKRIEKFMNPSEKENVHRTIERIVHTNCLPDMICT
jgi:hypothetical protein